MSRHGPRSRRLLLGPGHAPPPSRRQGGPRVPAGCGLIAAIGAGAVLLWLISEAT